MSTHVRSSMYFVVDVLKSDEEDVKKIITAQRQSVYVSLWKFRFFLIHYLSMAIFIILLLTFDLID